MQSTSSEPSLRRPETGLFHLLARDLRAGQHLDLLVAVALAGLLVLLAIVDTWVVHVVPPEKTIPTVLSGVLAVLGVLASSFLVTRHRLESLTRASSEDVVELLRQKPDLRPFLVASARVRMLGLNLRSTLHDHYYVLLEAVRRGLRLEVMVVDPTKVDLTDVALRFSRGGAPANFIADFEAAVRNVAELNAAALQANAVQLRLIRFVPSFSLCVFDRTPGEAVALAEIYNYRSKNRSVPKILVDQGTHPFWFGHFQDQFDTLWQAAEPVDWTQVK